jgi:hypothetical protein
MKDFVSSRWASLLFLAVLMSVACTILVRYGYPGTALLVVGMPVLAGVLSSLRSNRSIADVIHEVDVETGVVVPVRVATVPAVALPGVKGK